MVKNKYLETSGYDSNNKSIEDVLKQEYDNILYGEYWRGVLFVEKNGLYGVISISGDEIVPCKYAEYSDARHEWADMGFATEKTKVITPEQKILAEQRLALEQAKIEEEKKQSKQEDMETVDNLKKLLGESNEDLVIPPELEDYRQAWQKKIKYIYGGAKENIVKAAEKFKVNVETESDGSRLIKFELWWKKWKILDSKLDKHTNQNDNYISHFSCNSITNIEKDYVTMKWMRWDDIDNWENKELADYVREKQQEWLHIPSEKEMWWLLAELGEKINSDELEDQIAMLMYLTGMDWLYWLSMRNSISRPRLECFDSTRDFVGYCEDGSQASLCMIACE